jgi:hypothetical protein
MVVPDRNVFTYFKILINIIYLFKYNKNSSKHVDASRKRLKKYNYEVNYKAASNNPAFQCSSPEVTHRI